jgi:hypothetical protein
MSRPPSRQNPFADRINVVADTPTADRRPSAAPRTEDSLQCGYFAECEQDAEHEGPHTVGMYPEWVVPAIEPMAYVGRAEAGAAPDGLRTALEHYDERLDPNRPIEMPAREWRDAYFALARIALKELEQARAALAAAPVEPALDDRLLQRQQGFIDGMEAALLAVTYLDDPGTRSAEDAIRKLIDTARLHSKPDPEPAP